MYRSAGRALWILLAGLACGWLAPASGADEAAGKAHVVAAAPSPTDASPAESGVARLSRDEDYELFSVLVDTLDQVERNYVKDISRRELVEAAIQGILSKLDPYSNYISPDDLTKFRTNVESQFGGIGIQIRQDGDRLTIVTPLVGTPAYRAGLQAGDQIVEIDGQSTAGMATDEAVKRLKGEVGSEVTLKVLAGASRQSKSVTVQREVVHIETVLGDRRKSDDRWDFMLDDARKIGYIRVTAFSRETASEIRDALIDLKNRDVKGLIVDLRFNPGGLLNSAIEVCDLFISEGRIVSTEGRNSAPRAWEAHAPGTFEGFPMAVLVNHYSASASEIVAACLQDHGRAAIIGERTWGKGSVQNVIELEGGKSALKITTAGYKRPNGKNIDKPAEAKENDEWGVMPNDGLEVKLSNNEMRQVVEARHDRDIVRPKSPAAIAAAIAGAEAPAPTAAPVDEAASTKDDMADGEKPSVAPETATDAASPVEPAPDKPAVVPPQETQGASKPGARSRGDGAAGKRSAQEVGLLIDKQLQKAIEHLAAEIAKSK